MLDHVTDTAKYVWAFVRGDVPPSTFEQWLHANPSLESDLGANLYCEGIATDYRNTEAAWRIRGKLDDYLRATFAMPCECPALADICIVDMGHEGPSMEHFVEVGSRGEP